MIFIMIFQYYQTFGFLFCMFLCGCAFFPHHIVIDETGVEMSSSSVSLREGAMTDGYGRGNGFVLQPNRKRDADFLFVADTSYHMVKHLEEVPSTFKGFLPRLSSFLLFKMGVTNADYDPNVFSYFERDLFKGRVMWLELDGNLLPYKFLYPYFTKSEEVFLDTLKRYQAGDIPNHAPDQYINPCDLPPYCQGNVRSPIQSLMSAFSVSTDLFRKNVDLFIAIIFTNGDDEYVDDNTANTLVSEFQKHHGPRKKIRIYSIAIIPEDEECLNSVSSAQYDFATATYSKNIHALVKATGGDTISICEPNYSPLADMIVQSL